jgi:hypothetical protein
VLSDTGSSLAPSRRRTWSLNAAQAPLFRGLVLCALQPLPTLGTVQGLISLLPSLFGDSLARPAQTHSSHCNRYHCRRSSLAIPPRHHHRRVWTCPLETTSPSPRAVRLRAVNLNLTPSIVRFRGRPSSLHRHLDSFTIPTPRSLPRVTTALLTATSSGLPNVVLYHRSFRLVSATHR